MAKPLTSWLVPSFSQHNLRLAVSELCLHVSVMKFWHKFASLRQVNTPSSWDKFQNCCTDMYLIRFLPNFAVFCVFLWISWDFTDLPEFRRSATARNIRSPWVMLIVARENPYPLALSDSLEDYIGLKGALSFSLAWTGKYKIDHAPETVKDHLHDSKFKRRLSKCITVKP